VICSEPTLEDGTVQFHNVLKDSMTKRSEGEERVFLPVTDTGINAPELYMVGNVHMLLHFCRLTT
jgi:hypothetical protein